LLRNRGEIMDYQIDISFSTDYPIDEFEVEDLLSAIIAQIEEPTSYKGEQARYTTKDIVISLTP
jgi:hypothetical protein